MTCRRSSQGDDPSGRRMQDAPSGCGKRKWAGGAQPTQTHALVSCYDDCDKLVEVDLRLLGAFGCRLYRVITYDPPSEDANGRLFWRSKMTRAMLTTFLRSLEHGELSLSKNVSVAEAMTTFEYENVPIGVPLPRSGEVEAVRQPPPGSVFEKRFERVHDIVTRTSEQIAHALARWPRLEVCLDTSLTGLSGSNTCTATRAWVRFCKKPTTSRDAGDPSVLLARRWPQWLSTTLAVFGIVRSRLVKDNVVDETRCDEEAFTALETSVSGHALGWLLATPHDFPRHSMDKTARAEQTCGERFASGIRNCILENAGQSNAPSHTVVPRKADVKYARACVSLAEYLLMQAPSPTSMFAGTCCDDAGKSPERQQLARSLSARGIKVVRWADDDKGPTRPLVFPPAWSEGPLSGSVHCAVLLDFTDRR